MSGEIQMIKFFNIARQHPAYFISIIDKQLESFLNEKEITINEDLIYETNEGKKAWKEARSFLKKQVTLPPLEIHQGLILSAKDHVTDLANNSLFGHTGSDKCSFSERILRHCKKGQGSMAEIIGADFNLQNRNSAELTVLGLIIDDGVVDRGHRKTIFNPQYRFIGCKSAIQADKIITVFNLTQNRLQLRGQSKVSEYSSSHSYKRQSISSNRPQDRRNSTSSRFKAMKMEEKQLENKVQSEISPKMCDTSSHYKESKVKSPFESLNSNLPSKVESIAGTLKETVNSEYKDGKKISQKKENHRVVYEENAKITQKYTHIYFEDGTHQQNVERHTVFS